MSAVIKKNQVPRSAMATATVSLVDHMAEVRSALDHARSEASRIVREASERAKRQFDDARTSGYEAGYEQGFQCGKDAGHEEASRAVGEAFARDQAGVVSALEDATQQINALKDDLRSQASQDLLRFALAFARKLTFEIGVRADESIQANLARAVEAVGKPTALTVRLNPHDRDTVARYAPQLLAGNAKPADVTIVADDAVAVGGCIVQTEQSQVDATLETQIDTLVTLMLGAKEETHDEHV